jgi:predicted GNAT family N-acyltransferase
MTAEIGVVFHRFADHAWLPRIREWMTENAPSFARLGVRAPVQPQASLDEAFSWRAQLPFERLVVAIGYSSRDIQDCQTPAGPTGEPIIVGDPATAPGGGASASFLSPPKVVTCRDVVSQIRKSLIRVGLRNRVEIRPPSSDREFSEYFSLRYKVYDATGYLREENRRARTHWDIDHWDRSAVPLCAINREGKVIGALRLIRSHGAEEQPYVSRIQSLVDGVNDPTLKELYRFPNVNVEPFDVLMEFRGFRSHFCDLIRRGRKPAEIGRVVVDPEYRGQFLSEALVDTAVSSAQAKGVSSIFLACRKELGPLYEKCGFAAVPGIQSDKFLNIALPSIVMEKQI